MQLTRQEDISLYLYIRDVVIGPHYAETAAGQDLTRVSSNLWDMGFDTLPEDPRYPFKRGDSSGWGRGILYFDYVGETCLFGAEQTSIVTVVSGSTPITDFRVNYLKGQIESSLDLTDCTVDYQWNYVATLDAWPTDDVPFLPIVSIELQRARPRPLQLGGGDIRDATWNVQIFARNKGERDDLMDIIYNGINQRRCPLYTFQNGLPLVGTGFFNSKFSTEFNYSYTSLFFEDVDKKLTGLPKWGFYEQEQVNRYRAEITFTTKAYRN